MHDLIEVSCDPADEVYATLDDFGGSTNAVVELIAEELPFDIPRD
jgi:hypothetical protein